MKTETELRIEFQSEMDTKVFNEQGEIDIDYVLWLESKVLASQSQPTDEQIYKWAKKQYYKIPKDIATLKSPWTVEDVTRLRILSSIEGAKALRDKNIPTK